MPPKKASKPVVTEAHVVEACVAYLQLDSWRALKQEPISRREWGKGSGEMGMPDWLFLRYQFPFHSDWPDIPEMRVVVEGLWVEFKRPGGKPKPHQVTWAEAERGRGALVWVVDSFEALKALYGASGLARRVR